MEYLQSHHKLAYNLILHGRGQKFKGGDFNKRIAFLCFDNSIELSITVYLTYYHSGPSLSKSPTKMKFHEKIDELMKFISLNSLSPLFTQAELMDFHETRNKIYHEGISIIPLDTNIEKINQASEWIFRNIFNFDYPDPFENWGTGSYGITDRGASIDIAPKLDIVPQPDSRKLDENRRIIILTLTGGNNNYMLEDVISKIDPIITVTDGYNNILKHVVSKETSQHIELMGYFIEGKEQEIEFTFSFEDEYFGEISTRTFKRVIKHIT